jgi:hypothetical protein
MKITKFKVQSGARGRSIDTPIRFPSATQPSLLTAPDTRITIKDASGEIDLDEKTKLEDAKKSIRFGGKVLSNSSSPIQITTKGSMGYDGPFFFIAVFPDGKRYKYWFDSQFKRDDAVKARFNIGKFVNLVKNTSYQYERLQQ